MNKLKVSYALRHATWEYELEMDEGGWVPINQLLDSLHKTEKWKNLRVTDLSKMIEISEKKRHEIKNGNIRVFYGHSLPVKILKEEEMPPNVLYHGTARRFPESINKNGLLPQNRQYVHLSQDLEIAQNVGKRHDVRPCILIIDAKMASNEGIKFYTGNEKVLQEQYILHIRAGYVRDYSQGYTQLPSYLPTERQADRSVKRPGALF